MNSKKKLFAVRTSNGGHADLREDFQATRTGSSPAHKQNGQGEGTRAEHAVTLVKFMPFSELDFSTAL